MALQTQELIPLPHFCFRLLSTLVKQKPHAAEDVFHSIGENFVQLVEKCCGAQRRDVCFQEEVSVLFKQTHRGVLGYYPSPIATVRSEERSQTE